MPDRISNAGGGGPLWPSLGSWMWEGGAMRSAGPCHEFYSTLVVNPAISSLAGQARVAVLEALVLYVVPKSDTIYI